MNTPTSYAEWLRESCGYRHNPGLKQLGLTNQPKWLVLDEHAAVIGCAHTLRECDAVIATYVAYRTKTLATGATNGGGHASAE